ncbi:fatty acid desaturase [Neisseria sp.]|uniref:fatty acid desaturase n=1 Tax=Neisseria sp. TaxID=192066 RepID=UPI0035A08AE6
MTRPAKPAVEWRDLLALSRRETAYNVLLSLPFLSASWYFAAKSLYLPALAMSFFFFTAALRQAHDCYHHSIGLGRRGIRIMLFLVAATMLCSTHAIRYTHLQTPPRPARRTRCRRQLGAASRMAGRIVRRRVFRPHPMAGIGTRRPPNPPSQPHRHAADFGYFDRSRRMAASRIGVPRCRDDCRQRAGGLFRRLVHRDRDNSPDGSRITTRTERRRWANAATFNLLYHAEHHLFARVPSNRLPELARRLDAAAPS